MTGGKGRCYGRLDLPLAEPATAIAALVEALAPVRPAPMRATTIHTSSLVRCSVVAEALALAWGLPAPIPDPRLLELDFGAWEGLAWDDIAREVLDRWAADLAGFAAPGGESGTDLITRVTAFWHGLKGVAGAHVIITHGGPLKVLLALAEGRPVDLTRTAPAPGSVLFGTPFS